MVEAVGKGRGGGHLSPCSPSLMFDSQKGCRPCIVSTHTQLLRTFCTDMCVHEHSY